jgi:hypothetical protein
MGIRLRLGFYRRHILVIFPSMPEGFRLGLIAISLQLGQERLGHLG